MNPENTNLKLCKQDTVFQIWKKSGTILQTVTCTKYVFRSHPLGDTKLGVTQRVTLLTHITVIMNVSKKDSFGDGRGEVEFGV